MSYQILYEPKRKGKYPPVKRKKAYWPAVIMLIMLIVLFAVPNAASSLKDILLPGDPQVTEAAIVTFTADLKAGESIKEAFTEFCLVILNGAA